MSDNGYVNTNLLRTMILAPMPLEGEKKVYLGPRKIDDPPQASFHYGDGSYVIQFHYSKDGKANEKCGDCRSNTTPEDKKDKGDLPQFMDPGSYISF